GKGGGGRRVSLILRKGARTPNEFTAIDLRLRTNEPLSRTAFARAAKTFLFRQAGKREEIAFASFEQKQMELRTSADWVLRPRLRKVPGVAQVLVVGGGRKQYQVLVDPRALLEHDVTLHEVEEAVRESNVSASGGFLERGDRELPTVVLSRLGPGALRVLRQLEQ